MNKIKLSLILFLLIGSVSCRNTPGKRGVVDFPGVDPEGIETVNLTMEEIEEISRSLTSPVEIANLLLSREIPYSSAFITPSVDPGNMITEFDKAIGLGFLGADLGYLNMYEKTAANPGILESIGKLSNDLGVAQMFDQKAIKRLSGERSNADSLIFISLESFTRIDKYLKDDGRDHLSALMIIGAWIEGQYLATRVITQSNDKVLKERIGEQKIILGDIVLLASEYCNRSDEFRQLCEDLRKLNDVYSDIRITYSKTDPDSVIKNGALVITQAEKSEVEITDDQLAEIIEITGEIRNKLVLNN
jgi:hypothetical protein